MEPQDNRWLRLARNPDFQALFQHQLVRARSDAAVKALTALGGEERPAKLGEHRGFLDALRLIGNLPTRLADIESKQAEHADLERADLERDWRLESLAAGG